MAATYNLTKRPPTAFTKPAFAVYEVQTLDLAGAAIPIPLDEDDALLAAADRGWIDVRAARSICASGAAAGAQATFTAQIKAGPNAPAVALALADGVIAAGTHELLINGDIAAAYIRFLVAGTASAGVNMASLYVITK